MKVVTLKETVPPPDLAVEKGSALVVVAVTDTPVLLERPGESPPVELLGPVLPAIDVEAKEGKGGVVSFVHRTRMT